MNVYFPHVLHRLVLKKGIKKETNLVIHDASFITKAKSSLSVLIQMIYEILLP